MTISDSFRILGLPRNAHINDLRIAYREKAKKYHPDRKGGNDRQFSILQEAYSFLLDCQFLDKAHKEAGAGKKEEQNKKNRDAVKRKASEERTRRNAERQTHEARKHNDDIRKASEERTRRNAERQAHEARKRNDEIRKASEERTRRNAEKEAHEVRKRNEEIREASEEQIRLDAESKASFCTLSTSKQLFAAGKTLKESSNVEKKISAIKILVNLKRKSAYPFLRNALFDISEKVKLASVEAIGELKIYQAIPELGSLMSSKSIKIKCSILDTVEKIGKTKNSRNIVNLALHDDDPIIRKKAQSLNKRNYG